MSKRVSPEFIIYRFVRPCLDSVFFVQHPKAIRVLTFQLSMTTRSSSLGLRSNSMDFPLYLKFENISCKPMLFSIALPFPVHLSRRQRLLRSERCVKLHTYIVVVHFYWLPWLFPQHHPFQLLLLYPQEKNLFILLFYVPDDSTAEIGEWRFKVMSMISMQNVREDDRWNSVYHIWSLSYCVNDVNAHIWFTLR